MFELGFFKFVFVLYVIVISVVWEVLGFYYFFVFMFSIVESCYKVFWLDSQDNILFIKMIILIVVIIVFLFGGSMF